MSAAIQSKSYSCSLQELASSLLAGACWRCMFAARACRCNNPSPVSFHSIQPRALIFQSSESGCCAPVSLTPARKHTPIETTQTRLTEQMTAVLGSLLSGERRPARWRIPQSPVSSDPPNLPPADPLAAVCSALCIRSIRSQSRAVFAPAPKHRFHHLCLHPSSFPIQGVSFCARRRRRLRRPPRRWAATAGRYLTTRRPWA